MLMLKLNYSKISFIIICALLIQGSVSFPQNREAHKCKSGMVVSADEYATKIGLEVLKKGGNAIDAAVAVGYALAVSYPTAGNLGGGGFMVIHKADGKNTSIDYREKAPLSAKEDMYLDKNGKFIPLLSQEGVTSAGVPGSVAGLNYALEKYGSMKLKDILQPSIELAINGFPISHSKVASIKENLGDCYNKYPSTKKVFTKDGIAYLPGEIFKQPDLAKTLISIQQNGNDGFYKGEVARLLMEQINKNGGKLVQADLDRYKPVEREVVKGNYRGYDVISMAPPSSGGIALIEMLNILENFSFKREDWGSSSHFSALCETMKYTYADRSMHLGDPDFVKVPLDFLTSKDYAKTIYNKIINGVVPSSKIAPVDIKMKKESSETTHYSVYDKYGNAVSVTTTINSPYGSKVVVDGAGFLLNNEMDDFSAKPGTSNQFGLTGSSANSIQPEKRMLSCMTPTIVLKEGKPVLITGSPGGSTIMTVVLQVIMNYIDFKMSVVKAVSSPRIHHQWLPDQIDYEVHSIVKDVRNNLLNTGYKFGDERTLGWVEAITIDKHGFIDGVSDPRGNGAAEGY